MNRIIKIKMTAGIFAILIAGGCKPVSNHSENESQPGLPVTVSAIHTGQINSYLELSATSAFLFKSVIKAPVTGYIDNILINQGEAVKKDQTLFTIRTKEASALLGDSLKNLEFNGIVKVKTAAAGLISSIEHTKGDYVAEGDLLSQVAIPESFAFILDVPYELSGFVKVNTPCEIILPDSTSVKGIIKSRFPSMSVSSQTERYIVQLTRTEDLPENLTAKIRIVKKSLKDAASLPKSCILTDEIMQNFWVMKLINDSVAVKIPVTTGISEGEYVQIIQPFV